MPGRTSMGSGWYRARVSGVMLLLGMLWGLSALGGNLDKESIGKCTECHEEQVKSFVDGNHHAKIWEKRQGTFSCVTCHGAIEEHLKDPTMENIIGFGKKSKTDAETRSKQCLGCHSNHKELAFWNQGVHKQNGVSCASCHSTHGGAAAAKPTSESCFACHKDTKFQAHKTSHHPIIEGKVNCWDCHNPHGTMNHSNLKTENTNQLCYKCHGEKRGPFLYGHPPVEEDCMKCHVPHGSQHAKLLTEKVTTLCQNCHDGTRHVGMSFDGNSGFNGPTSGSVLSKASPREFGRQCLNCHSNIHGSNTVGTHGKAFAR